MSSSKAIGGSLLVAGTTIGGGMLALPVIVEQYGYLMSVLTLCAIWFMNLLIAFILLEVNLKLPPGASIISMSRKTLGRSAECIAWVCCLLFMYSILVAYVSGLHELWIDRLMTVMQLQLPQGVYFVVLLLVIGILIFIGTRAADYFNRCLMGVLIAVFCGFMLYLLPFSNIQTIQEVPNHLPVLAIPIIFTSFGYLVILPSLRNYLQSNVKQLQFALIVGSLIPLLLYLLWITAVAGVLPLGSAVNQVNLLQQSDPGTHIIHVLAAVTHNFVLNDLATVFVFLSMATSFIGVSLGLYDFLADGLSITKNMAGKLLLISMTCLPPILFTILFNQLFIMALGYAGLFSAIVYGIYPVLMVWRSRQLQMPGTYQFSGGRLSLLAIMLFSMLVIFSSSLGGIIS